MTNRLQELRTKSALISEILRAAALRYSRGEVHTSEATPVPSSYQQHPLRSVTSTSTSTCDSKPSHVSSNTELCFHARGISSAVSEECRLCLVQGSIHAGPGLMHHRRHSESTVSAPRSPTVRWSKPSRSNAGVCRAQVVSNYSTWCLSLEMCSNQQLSTGVEGGLHLASAVRHGVSRVWRLSLDHLAPRRKSVRTGFQTSCILSVV